MIKGNIVYDLVDNKKLDFEYDSDKYLLGFEKNVLSIKRRKEEKGKMTFNEDVSCFVQVNKDDRTYFLVGSHYGGIIIYEDYKDFEYLQKIASFSMDKYKLDNIRLSEDTFIVDKFRKGGRLYTIGDESATKFYERIYNDKKVKEFLNEKDINNMVLVDDEQFFSYYNESITDKLTYGIDINTKKIVTPIWSSLKNKLIHTYTEEDVERLKEQMDNNIGEEYDHYDYSFMREDHTLEEITKYFEIDRLYRKLNLFSKKPEGVYKETEYGTDINKEYIMKFVPNNKE